MRESCASVEKFGWVLHEHVLVAHLGLNVLFVLVVLMWCTSVSYPVVFDWSVNELQACVGQTNSCRVFDGCVALCFIQSRVSWLQETCSVEELRPDVGSG